MTTHTDLCPVLTILLPAFVAALDTGAGNIDRADEAVNGIAERLRLLDAIEGDPFAPGALEGAAVWARDCGVPLTGEVSQLMDAMRCAMTLVEECTVRAWGGNSDNVPLTGAATTIRTHRWEDSRLLCDGVEVGHVHWEDSWYAHLNDGRIFWSRSLAGLLDGIVEAANAPVEPAPDPKLARIDAAIAELQAAVAAMTPV